MLGYDRCQHWGMQTFTTLEPLIHYLLEHFTTKYWLTYPTNLLQVLYVFWNNVEYYFILPIGKTFLYPKCVNNLDTIEIGSPFICLKIINCTYSNLFTFNFFITWMVIFFSIVLMCTIFYHSTHTRRQFEILGSWWGGGWTSRNFILVVSSRNVVKIMFRGGGPDWIGGMESKMRIPISGCFLPERWRDPDFPRSKIEMRISEHPETLELK